MNLAEVTFEQIQEAVTMRLNDPEATGIAAEFSSQEFVVSYFKHGGVFDWTFQIKPPTCRDRDRFHEEILPLMQQLDEMLDSYVKELNEQFRHEYVRMLKLNSMACV